MPLDNSIFNYMESESPPSACMLEYIDMCRIAPSRMVGVHASTNNCSFVPSNKMGCTISTESMSAERAFVLLCEYDDGVKAIYDQPEPIMLRKYDKNSRLRTISYTSDFLIETIGGFYVVEVKTLKNLEKLVEKQPKNWKKLINGEYEYTPALDAFKKLGLRHRVWAYSGSIKIKIANIGFLMRSRTALLNTDIIEKRVNDLFREAYFWSLYDLKEALELDNYTPIIRMIDMKKVVADLSSSLLSEPKSCFVARNTELLEFGKKMSASKFNVLLPVERFSSQEIPSERSVIKVMDRLKRIASGEKSRSIRRWNEKISNGKKCGKNEFESLIDQSYKSGNKTRRINKVVLHFIEYYLLNDHAELKGLTKYRSYFRYCAKAKIHHASYPPVSWETFRKELMKIPESVIFYKRGGKRLRNGVLEPTNPIDRNLKYQLPWQAAAVDDYLSDIYLVFYTYDGKPYIERVWISGMIDLATSKILAFTISFKNPSKRSLSKVIRECVRLHGKLPQEIIFDRGSNFKSKYAAELLASLGVINSMRAAAYSRSGGEIERLFGEFKEQWLTQRPGNMADFKEARSVDGDKAPKKSAILKPYDFYMELRRFANWRDAKPVGIYDSTREDRFNSKAADFPFMGIDIPYNEKFLISTAVDIGRYTVDLTRGLHIADFYFWSPELSKTRGVTKKVEVRLDPENPHAVYALVENTWVPCYSSRILNYNALDSESQFIEGLIALETRNLKSKLTKMANESLVNIIDELDRKYKVNKKASMIEF